ncbi:MAG: hypothetical protein J6B88_08455 [Clostridia bacterium]|nr:hypothetical protein [Clostridia bacterium]
MGETKGMTEISLENTNLVLNALETKGEFISLTKGPSMRPMLRQGKDIVVITKPVGELKKGDVPLYKRRNYDFLVLHRILKVRDNDYIIRGDNTYSLEYVPKDYIVGVLKGFYRGGKYYDCNESRAYKVYIIFNRITYFPRKLWVKFLRPLLSKIKHSIFK